MKWSTRIYLATTLIALVVVSLLIWRLPNEYLTAIGVIIVAGLVSIVVAILGAILYGGLVGWQWLRILRAEADNAELKANLIESDHETWVREKIVKIDATGTERIFVEYARLGGIRLRVNSHDHNPTESERLFATTQQTTGQTKMLASGQVIPQLPASIDLLSILDSAERVLFEGPPDAGKTTLCLHVASRSQNVIIIDPHNEPDKWPADTRIIGGGRNFGQILKFIDWMVEELDRRAQMANQGDKNFVPITIIIDELPTLILNCGKDVSKKLAMMIIESRKFKFRVFIGAQSKLLKLLGLEGMGDVRRSLVMVHLDYDQITKQRVCTVDTGNGEQACWFPPFQSSPAQVILRPTSQEQQIIELFEAHQSLNEIARQVYGGIGGNQNKAIKEVLAKFGYVSA